MAAAGDEGYEKMVTCPYDKSHVVRKGTIQIHLTKCRKNYPNAEYMRCPFNSSHQIPKCEQEFHTQEECSSRANWDRGQFSMSEFDECSVQNLVPVNTPIVYDDSESWDNDEVQGSVLSAIRDQAANKNILRGLHCESKAKRKNFRLQEKKRHVQAMNKVSDVPKEEEGAVGGFLPPAEQIQPPAPLRKPTKQSKVPLPTNQDSVKVMAGLNEQLHLIKLNDPHSKDSSRPLPDIADAPPVAVRSFSYASMASQPREKRPGLPPSSSNTRPSTAMSIAASVNRTSENTPTSEGFCQISLPSRGRGVTRRNK